MHAACTHAPEERLSVSQNADYGMLNVYFNAVAAEQRGAGGSSPPKLSHARDITNRKRIEARIAIATTTP